MDTTISADAAARATWRFILQNPAHFLAFGLGVGLVPAAPGTCGTLLAFPLFWLLSKWLTAGALFAAIAAMFVAGIALCGRTGRALGRVDHGGIVWDEITAFLLVLFFTPSGAAWQASAFILFRAFDIFKPPPIRYYERTLGGGWGVMFDDLLAAFYTLLVLAIARTWTGT